MITILGIDPGITNTGLSLAVINPETKTINSITTYNIISDKLPLPDKDYISQEHGDRFAKLHAFKLFFIDFLQQTRPSIISLEDVYYNPRRPLVYRSIAEQTIMIRDSILVYDPYTPLHVYTPMEIKKTILQKAQLKTVNSKTAIQEALDIVLPKHLVDLNLLTEHERDSIAIMITALENI